MRATFIKKARRHHRSITSLFAHTEYWNGDGSYQSVSGAGCEFNWRVFKYSVFKQLPEEEKQQATIEFQEKAKELQQLKKNIRRDHSTAENNASFVGSNTGCYFCEHICLHGRCFETRC